MKILLLRRWNLFDRFEQVLLAGVLVVSLILIPLLVLFACAGDGFIRFVYEHRSFPVLSRLIQQQHPVEHYFAIKTEIALHLFVLLSLVSVFTVSGLMIPYRFFFSDKKVPVLWIILICCLATAMLFLYNPELKMVSNHTFFYAGPAYQILNGHTPPLDPLFGGEVLRYQWGHPWAAAVLSRILNITPFSSFTLLSVLPLAGCLYLLYKISNLLLDNPKTNVFSSIVTLYCGTFFSYQTFLKLKEKLPFYGGEPRIFPIIVKFNDNNGIPLGLVFFLLMVYGVLKLFERKKPLLYGFFVLLGTIGSLFFYTAYGPGILAWLGFIGLLWLMKYQNDDFRAFGRTLLWLCVLVAASFAAVWPYLRQVSSVAEGLHVRFFDIEAGMRNLFSFLLPISLTLGVILVCRNYLIKNLNRQKFLLMGCLFLSNMACYLFVHFPGNLEYKYLLLALLPFGIVGGIALARVQQISRWAALGLFVILSMPAFWNFRYLFESSPRDIFDICYVAPYQEEGTVLEGRDAEENVMYRWIRENTSVNAYFLDSQTKIPVYAQRTLWVAFDTGDRLPGYLMTASRIKAIHGYNDQEFSRRQQVAQNLFGSENSMTPEEIAAYLAKNKLFVVVRDNNLKVPLDCCGFRKVFTSETGRFYIVSLKE